MAQSNLDMQQNFSQLLNESGANEASAMQQPNLIGNLDEQQLHEDTMNDPLNGGGSGMVLKQQMTRR
jgi:hypothetical protein